MSRAVLVLLLALWGCATPISYTSQSLRTYDKDTEYALEERVDGFTVTIYYSRYQFIPESDAVATACKQALTSVAHEIADRKGRPIHDINEQRVRISMGRNGLTGITSCSATASADYK